MSHPQGFLGLPDLGDLLGQVTGALPPVVGDAIKGAVGKILDPADSSINVGDPQPPGERPIPVEPGTPHFAAAVKAIDTALGAIDAILKLGFLIPDDIHGVDVEDLLKTVRGGLVTVRGWLD